LRKAHTITKKFLEQRYNESGNLGVGISTVGLNPNPRLKKYYSWIYDCNMPYKSAQEVFYKDEHKLSLKKALDLIKYLKETNSPYAFVIVGYHRLGTKVFNYSALKEKFPDITFAVAYDEDTDEMCKELAGHK